MTDASSSADPDNSLGYQVRRCHRRFDRLLGGKLSEYNLKPGFWYYLRILWRDDGVSQRFLSDMTYVAENTTATMIGAMVEAGLVQRERDEQDRRKFKVSLTDKGRALEDRSLHHVQEINAIATRGIAQEDWQHCLTILRRMAENLEAEAEGRDAG